MCKCSKGPFIYHSQTQILLERLVTPLVQKSDYISWKITCRCHKCHHWQAISIRPLQTRTFIKSMNVLKLSFHLIETLSLVLLPPCCPSPDLLFSSSPSLSTSIRANVNKWIFLILQFLPLSQPHWLSLWKFTGYQRSCQDKKFSTSILQACGLPHPQPSFAFQSLKSSKSDVPITSVPTWVRSIYLIYILFRSDTILTRLIS